MINFRYRTSRARTAHTGCGYPMIATAQSSFATLISDRISKHRRFPPNSGPMNLTAMAWVRQRSRNFDASSASAWGLRSFGCRSFGWSLNLRARPARSANDADTSSSQYSKPLATSYFRNRRRIVCCYQTHLKRSTFVTILGWRQSSASFGCSSRRGHFTWWGAS